MIFDFLKAKKLPENFAVLDFGSGSIKAVIFDSSGYKASGALSVVGTGEEVYPSGTIVSGVISNIDQFRDTAKASLRKASFACGFNPSWVVPCFSAEFSKAISAKVKVSRKAPEKPLSRQEWSEYEKKIKETLLSEAVNEMASITGNAECEVELTEKVLVNSHSGGEVLNLPPFGQRISELQIDYLMGFTQKSTLKLMKNIVRSLGKKELLWTSKIINLVRFLSQKDESLDAIFVDIDSESTDVSVVLGGFLIGVRTVPFGQANFGSEAAPNSTAIGLSTKDWLSMVSVALSDFEGVKTFPPMVVIYGSGSKQPSISEALQGFTWTKLFPFVASPRIVRLEDIIDLSAFEDKTGKAGEFVSSVVVGQSFRQYVKDRT